MSINGIGRLKPHKRVICAACDGTGGVTKESKKACSVCQGSGVETVVPVVEPPKGIEGTHGIEGPKGCKPPMNDFFVSRDSPIFNSASGW